jgi:hypothetical protein
MPLPFILAGAALVAGGYGVKKGFDAKSDMDDAKNMNRAAKNIYDEAQVNLENERQSTQNKMESLGLLKANIYQETLKPFVDNFSKIKNIDFKESDNTDDLLFSNEDKEELYLLSTSVVNITDAMSGGVTAIGAGGLAGLAAYGGVGFLGTASTGTAIGTLSGAAATNATLAWLGGGSLASGGLGMAGGTAVLGGIIAGPVLAVGGMMLASKAEAARNDAYSNKLEAELAAEEMETAQVKTTAIGKSFDEINDLLTQLNNVFTPLLTGFENLVKNNIDYRTYSDVDKHGVYMVVSLAKTIKFIMDTKLLDQEGSITAECVGITTNKNELITGINNELGKV